MKTIRIGSKSRHRKKSIIAKLATNNKQPNTINYKQKMKLDSRKYNEDIQKMSKNNEFMH